MQPRERHLRRVLEHRHDAARLLVQHDLPRQLDQHAVRLGDDVHRDEAAELVPRAWLGEVHRAQQRLVQQRRVDLNRSDLRAVRTGRLGVIANADLLLRARTQPVRRGRRNRHTLRKGHGSLPQPWRAKRIRRLRLIDVEIDRDARWLPGARRGRRHVQRRVERQPVTPGVVRRCRLVGQPLVRLLPRVHRQAGHDRRVTLGRVGQERCERQAARQWLTVRVTRKRLRRPEPLRVVPRIRRNPPQVHRSAIDVRDLRGAIDGRRDAIVAAGAQRDVDDDGEVLHEPEPGDNALRRSQVVDRHRHWGVALARAGPDFEHSDPDLGGHRAPRGIGADPEWREVGLRALRNGLGVANEARRQVRDGRLEVPIRIRIVQVPRKAAARRRGKVRRRRVERELDLLRIRMLARLRAGDHRAVAVQDVCLEASRRHAEVRRGAGRQDGDDSDSHRHRQEDQCPPLCHVGRLAHVVVPPSPSAG